MIRATACVVAVVLSTMRIAAAADAAAERARVDLFRAQSPASLVAEPVTASVESPSMPMEPPESPSATLRSDIPQSKPVLPFDVSGEWSEPDQHVIVLEGMGRMFLLCRRCGDVRGAVRPGQVLAGGYRVKSFDDVAVVLTGPDGRQHRLPIGGHPQ
ncbi:hypothetical protein KDX26_16100 [Burkholderia cenocepacia]|uniref:hypothetical protein n=1 Tax=Burkholderia cepacia complex TaxID=87882 RepID=UPI0011B20245|nr:MULTISPECIES: hypothetical protein [Burkholderia cepacia complex]MBR8383913.1 hypothetical protein [Burkholderia cenocepacia]MBR8434922.1 hypothetical protein [Burkholderia cenocepacia]